MQTISYCLSSSTNLLTTTNNIVTISLIHTYGVHKGGAFHTEHITNFKSGQWSAKIAANFLIPFSVVILAVTLSHKSYYIVTGKFTDFPVCVIRNIFIRKLSHLTISSPFILINQKMYKNHSSF